MGSKRTLEERIRLCEKRAETAILAAARKSGEAEVSKAEFQQYRIELAMLLNDRLNVDQVPVNLGDLLQRLEVLEAKMYGWAPPVAPAAASAPAVPPPAPAPVLALISNQGSTVAPPAPIVAPVPTRPQLTLVFSCPVRHQGQDFKVTAQFSEPITNGWRDVRDFCFETRGGTIVSVRRSKVLHNDSWVLNVSPHGMDDVVIAPTTAPITSEGDRLSNPEWAVVPA